MVNNVVLVGRLTRDPELKLTTNNSEVVNFTIAVNRNFKNANGEYDADFISCVAFGPTARFMSNYLRKGRLISVEGRIQTRSYDNQVGQRVYVTEVVANQVQALDSARDASTYAPVAGDIQPPTQQPASNEEFKTTGGNQETPYDFLNLGDIDESDLPF